MKQLLNKYYNIPLPAKASVWFMITNVLQSGISFFTVPLFTRLLSPNEFGQINVYQSWLSIMTIFATLTLWGGVFNNGMLKYEEDRERFLSSLQGLSTTITMALLFLVLIFSNFITKLVGLPILLIILMFIQICFIPSLNLWSAKQRYDFKYKKLVIITIIMSLANPILGLILVWIARDGGVARIVSVAIIQISIGLALYINNMKLGKSFFDKKYWSYAVSFNLPLIPHYLSQTILSQADRIMINNMVGTDKAGIYSIAYSVGMILLFVVSSVNSTFTPWTYKQLKKKNYTRIGEISNFLLIVISAMILGLISFAPEIIKLMAPPEYSEAMWAIPPIALSTYFIFLYGLCVNVEFYFEENKFIMIASIIAAILNIILNLLLIPIFGYIVAGYTTLISYIIYSLSHFRVMNIVISKNNIQEKIYNLKIIVILSLLLIGASFFIMLMYDSILIRLLIISIVSVVIFINKGIVIEKINILKES